MAISTTDAPRNFVRFYSESVLDKKKTAAMGRPIHKDMEFVEIRFPGDKHRIFVGPAHEVFRYEREMGGKPLPITYAMEYPDHYEHFKKGMEFQGEGTPLSELPFLTNAQRADLKALNIHTADQLAALEGTPLQKAGMGARALKEQAKAWLEKASGSSGLTQLAAENAGLKAQMEALQAQMAEMAQHIAAKPSAAPGPAAAPANASVFAEWSDDDIKAFIADRTGARPRGNPAHATLIQMADEIIADEKAKGVEAA